MFGKRGGVRFSENAFLYIGIFLVACAAFGVLQGSITGFTTIDECSDADADGYVTCTAEEVDCYSIQALTTATSDQQMPAIHDGKVFYESSYGSDSEIVYYDFDTGDTYVLNALEGNDVAVDVNELGFHTWMNNEAGYCIFYLLILQVFQLLLLQVLFLICIQVFL